MEQTNGIINIHGVDCYEENGVAYLNLEAVAVGLGITKTDTKDGVEYERINKQALINWLKDFGILNSENPKLPAFIPENIFYRLAMKAKNETAQRFQAMVADEIIPAIRKHGGYLTPEKIEEVLLDPDTIIQLATQLKQERAKRIEAERTKAYISDKKTATAMATASAKSKEAEKYKQELGKSKQFASVKAVQAKTGRKYDWRALRDYCKEKSLEMHKVHDENYGEVNSYPAIVWMNVYNEDILKLF
jgi:prophage antirepressor-like protein